MLFLIIFHICSCEGVEHQCGRIQESEQGLLCEFENIHLNESNVLRITEAPSQDIEAVQFRNSSIFQLPDLFLVFPHLKHVDVDSTGLKWLNSSNFEHANEMKFLLARFNQIERITAGTFAMCRKLEYLVMSHNLISRIEERAFEGLTNIEAIFLDFNHLITLPEKLLQPVENLQHFSMSNNKLIEIPEKLFMNNAKLSTLNLADNFLTYFNGEQFEKLKSLEHLRLDHNKLIEVNLSSCRSVEVIVDSNYLQVLEVNKETRFISGNENPLKKIILHENFGLRHYNFSFKLVNEIIFFVTEHCCTSESLENFQDLIHSFGDLSEKNLDVHDWQCKFEKTVEYRNEEDGRVFNNVCRKIEKFSVETTTTMRNNFSEVSEVMKTIKSIDIGFDVESTTPSTDSHKLEITLTSENVREIIKSTTETSDEVTTTEKGIWKSMKNKISGWRNKAKTKWENVVG